MFTQSSQSTTNPVLVLSYKRKKLLKLLHKLEDSCTQAWFEDPPKGEDASEITKLRNKYLTKLADLLTFLEHSENSSFQIPENHPIMDYLLDVLYDSRFPSNQPKSPKAP